MLRLTAELADAWNICWLGRADELPEHVTSLRDACADVGRDPATLEVTVGQIVTFPWLAEDAEVSDRLERFTFTDPETLAAEWHAFAAQGVGHLMLSPLPFSPDCLALLTAAWHHYREGSAA